MSKVISFEEAKARREQAKLVDAPPVVQDGGVLPRQAPLIKGIALSEEDKSLFLREARKFRFIKMTNSPSFVTMKTSVLPPAFPPDSHPPLVA